MEGVRETFNGVQNGGFELCAMHQINIKELSELDLGDIRRNERFVKIIDNLIRKPGNSIPQLSDDWYETKATYEFFKSDKFSHDDLIKAIRQYGVSNVEASTVLVVHDRSSFSYNNLEATQGLGYVENKLGRGILSQNSIAVSACGTPLALLNQILWTRPMEQLGKAVKRKEKLPEQKESYKWCQSIKTCNELLDKKIKKIHIADREADIYEVFFMPPDANAELLIRACQNRKIAQGSPLWQHIHQSPIKQTIALTVLDKDTGKSRQIKADVRHSEVEILRPRNQSSEYESVKLTAIEIKEKSKRQNAIHWQLLTTLDVNTAQDINRYIQWYTYRWLIERFHFALKSGCKVEQLQLKQADSLKKAIATYSLASFKIMQMTYQSRATPQANCEIVFTKQEWQTLFSLATHSAQIPKNPPTLKQAVTWIAQMGGYLNRKSDGPPGLITIWRGYRKLTECVKLFSIINEKNLGKE